MKISKTYQPYAICAEDLRGSISQIMERLQDLGNKYGYDAEIELELEDDSDTFGSRQVIAVSLKSSRKIKE